VGRSNAVPSVGQHRHEPNFNACGQTDAVYSSSKCGMIYTYENQEKIQSGTLNIQIVQPMRERNMRLRI
jgi:hypothetical protein